MGLLNTANISILTIKSQQLTALLNNTLYAHDWHKKSNVRQNGELNTAFREPIWQSFLI